MITRYAQNRFSEKEMEDFDHNNVGGGVPVIDIHHNLHDSNSKNVYDPNWFMVLLDDLFELKLGIWELFGPTIRSTPSQVTTSLPNFFNCLET